MSDAPRPSQEAIFTAALALPPEQRSAFVDRVCGEDRAMAAYVRELLRGYEENSGFLETSPVGADPVAGFSDPVVGVDHVPGDRIGHYKLLERIGEGGAGVVFMADQMEPVRRRVALKIIKLGLDTKEFIARFEAERQALALMDHPNIAKVFDAGTTDRGRPYFAMELVRGVTITRYCDENRLPPEARLRLFIQICRAVQHAHQKGIIHRDLKPSNILVTLHDGVPVPKVIDFGIAKATSTPLTDKTLFTHFLAFLGTPAYTSPEQIEMSGLDVDTRSDIYSLGVLLYELLTGRPPFDPDALVESGLEAMRRTIRETDPPRPSHRLTTLTVEERTSIAQQRSTDAGKLSLLLRGDLDWIVMRCLEKDRTRRYETANGLARDLQRHLESEPVWARPPTGAYRLQKFIRRHRLGFAAATAVAVSLIAGLVATSVLLIRESAARRRAVRAEHAEGQLRQQAETARELETKRSARTALDLADQLLAKGEVADALAYLIHAARKDPDNVAIAPRLASVLTTRNFLIPERAPLQLGSRVLALRYTRDGRSIHVGTEDGTFRVLDAASGAVTREVHLGKAVKRGGWTFARDSDAGFAIRFVDDTIAPFDVATGLPRWPAIHADIGLPPDVGLGGIEGVQLSPDGRWFYAKGGSEFWLFDAASGESVMKLPFTEFYFGPDFSADGSRMTLSWGDVVRVWSLPDGKPALEPIAITERNTPGLYLLPFLSPDGQILAVCDPWVGVHVFDAHSGEKLRTVPRATALDPSSAGYAADGRFFIAGEHAAELLNLATNETVSLPVVLGFATQSQRIATEDGKLLLTVSTDGCPRLWDTATTRLVAEPAQRQAEKSCVALSPDGRHVLIGTGTGEIYRLRVGRGAARPLVVPRPPPAGWRPFLPEAPARVFFFQRDRASAIDVATGREVPGGFAYPAGDTPPLFEQPNLSFDVRQDFEFLVVRDASGVAGSRAWEIHGDGTSRAITLQDDNGSPPGGIGIALSGVGDLVAHNKRGNRAVGVWNLRTGATVGPGCSFENREVCAYQGIDFSPDGKLLAGGIYTGDAVVIWEAATGRPLTVIKTGADAPTEKVHFSPDGTRLLTVNERDETQLWDPVTGEPRSPVIRSTDALDAAFSPDGRCFVVWGDHVVSVWDGHSGAPVSRPNATGGGGVKFSPDSTRLVAFDRNRATRVWDVHTGQPLTEPLQEGAPDFWLEGFSPDGGFVQTLSDGRSNIWSVPPSLPSGVGSPEWLLRLASICATRKINDAEQCLDAPELIAQIDDLRRELAALPADSPLVGWGRWFLDDSPMRPIAPGFMITPADAEKLEAEFAGELTRP